MENYVLYDEIGRGAHSVVYKGRRKGTINFVAIYCIEKTMRPEVTNRVRLTHEIKHNNIVDFLEWYETSNHLWLVVELCTGGSLETLVRQDGHLPEASVRKFGIDIANALHYIHSLGIMFCDLRPHRILVDGPGILKLSDFCLAKVEGEVLADFFQQTMDDFGESLNDEGGPVDEAVLKRRTTGCPTYFSPEVIGGGDSTIASDLWAFGCLLYELYSGSPPFVSDSFQDLMENILHKDIPTPRQKGDKGSGKPSKEILDLFDGLLKKDPGQRFGWDQVLSHPFWHGVLDVKSSTTVLSSAGRKSNVSDSYQQLSSSGDTIAVAVSPPLNLTPNKDTVVGEGDYRPKTAPEKNDLKSATFTLSSRPHTSQANVNPASYKCQKVGKQPLEEISRDEADLGRTTVAPNSEDELSTLIYTSSDLSVTQIVDNPKIQKVIAQKWDPKLLPVPSHSGSALSAMTIDGALSQYSAITEYLKTQNDKSPNILKAKLHLVTYVADIVRCVEISNALLNQYNLICVLTQLLKANNSHDFRLKTSRAIALICHHADVLDDKTLLSECVLSITELIRDNFRNQKLKQGLLPAVGELLYLIASSEEYLGRTVESWTVPSITYTIISRCLREGEDVITQHYAAKIIENVSTTVSVHSQKFSCNEIGLLLWYVFSHSTSDALKITALSTLCKITKHSVTIFQCVIEKVGLPNVLGLLSTSISRVQQAIATMFLAILASGIQLQRLVSDKDFVVKVMRLLESPSTVIRAKAFLICLIIIRSNCDILLQCCQARLVMYIERDSRKQQGNSSRSETNQQSYINHSLELLTNQIVDKQPAIIDNIIVALDTVSGRRHPSTVQMKQLRAHLPLLPIILHLVTSQVFRPRIVNDRFFSNIGILLQHVRAIDAGETSVDNSGSQTAEEYIHTVLSILEAITQHSRILLDYQSQIVDTVLIPLAELASSDNGDIRLLCLGLLSELASLYTNNENIDEESKTHTQQQLTVIMKTNLLPHYEQILIDQDPLPNYGLRLLLATLDHSPTIVKEIERYGLVPILFQVLLDHQDNLTGKIMENIVGILNSLVSHKETDMVLLYSQGLVDLISNLIIEVAAQCLDCEDTSKKPTALLLSLLDTLNHLFKYVSNVVRQALQAKKGGNDVDTQAAEDLLQLNKPFTELTSILMHLLCYDDGEVEEWSCRCLFMMVQLFGGVYEDTMTPENMESLTESLKKSDSKRQKVILRIIKRVLSAETRHTSMVKEHGQNLIATIRFIEKNASSNADVTLSSVANEVLKLL